MRPRKAPGQSGDGKKVGMLVAAHVLVLERCSARFGSAAFGRGGIWLSTNALVTAKHVAPTGLGRREPQHGATAWRLLEISTRAKTRCRCVHTRPFAAHSTQPCPFCFLFLFSKIKFHRSVVAAWLFGHCWSATCPFARCSSPNNLGRIHVSNFWQLVAFVELCFSRNPPTRSKKVRRTAPTGHCSRNDPLRRLWSGEASIGNRPRCEY